MKKQIVSTVASLLVGTGTVFGQVVPAPMPTTPEPPPAAASGAPAAPAPAPMDGGTEVAPGAPFFAPGDQPYVAGPGVVEDGLDGEPGCEAEGHKKKIGCVWGSIDYLLWSVKNGPNPVPLVTSGTPASSGFLGSPGTNILFGGSDLNYGTKSGTRMTVGLCDPNYVVGLEVTGFYLGSSSAKFAAASDATGSPIFARPFLDPVLGLEDATLVSFPGAFVGRVAASSSNVLWGVEANLLRNRIDHLWRFEDCLPGCCLNSDLIVGFRYLDLEEDLDVSQQSRIIGNGLAGFNGARITAPNTLGITDQFEARNQFYGGQVGLQNEFRKNRFYVDVLGKVALGATHMTTNINGRTTLITATGVAASTPGGLLALPTNIGIQSRNNFAVVPEFGVNVGYEVTKYMRMYVGYTFLYWSDVARPGEQIVRQVNKTQLPSSLSFGPAFGPNQPAPTFQTTDFWAQGFNAGVAFRY